MAGSTKESVALDLCVYPKGEEPDRRLGRIWAKWEIPDDQRIALAKRIKTIGHMANLASDIAEFEKRIKALLEALTMWPADEADQIYLLMNWNAVWTDAVGMKKIGDDQEAEARKDPQKVAEIADIDLSAMWENFRASERGRSILLNEFTMPHRLFLAILKRDYLVHHILQKYALQRIFLEYDPVEQVPHWAKSIDDILKISGHVTKVSPGGLADVDNRIQGLWIAADVCGICEFSWEAGPLRLIHLIQDRRNQAADKYTFTVRIDAVLRDAIYKKNYLQRTKHKTVSQAINAVLGDPTSKLRRENPDLPSEADRLVERTLHECMRSDSQLLIESTMQNISYSGQGQGDHRAPPTRPRPPPPDDQPTPVKTKSAIKREKQKARLAKERADSEKEIKRLREAKGKGKGKKKGEDRPTGKRRMPDDEFNALREINPKQKSGKRACRYWNSSIGCDKADGSCPFAHNLCILCGGNHKWINCPKKK